MLWALLGKGERDSTASCLFVAVVMGAKVHMALRQGRGGRDAACRPNDAAVSGGAAVGAPAEAAPAAAAAAVCAQSGGNVSRSPHPSLSRYAQLAAQVLQSEAMRKSA